MIHAKSALSFFLKIYSSGLNSQIFNLLTTYLNFSLVRLLTCSLSGSIFSKYFFTTDNYSSVRHKAYLALKISSTCSNWVNGETLENSDLSRELVMHRGFGETAGTFKCFDPIKLNFYDCLAFIVCIGESTISLSSSTFGTASVSPIEYFFLGVFTDIYLLTLLI